MNENEPNRQRCDLEPKRHTPHWWLDENQKSWWCDGKVIWRG